MQKRWVLVMLVAMALTLAFAGTALAGTPDGSAVISNELSGTVTVQGATVEATWNDTDRYGTHEGTVYKEFELLVNDERVSLHQDNVSSITVVEPGNVSKDLTPNTDETLWFNIANPSGNYVFTVVTKDNTTYTATLSWTGMNILNIGWDLPDTKTVTKGEQFTVESTASLNDTLANGGVTEVGRVLYVIEVTDSSGNAADAGVATVASSDGQALGYDETGDFFYWGPREGFTFSTSMYTDGKVTTPFNVTFNNAGTYDIKAYAVQLDAE